MNRLEQLRKALETVRKFSYIPVSMREDILNCERELIELESENEKAN